MIPLYQGASQLDFLSIVTAPFPHVPGAQKLQEKGWCSADNTRSAFDAWPSEDCLPSAFSLLAVSGGCYRQEMALKPVVFVYSVVHVRLC